MKDLFMELLLNLQNQGHMTEANMWEDLITIKIDGDDCRYVVSVRKEDKQDEN